MRNFSNVIVRLNNKIYIKTYYISRMDSLRIRNLIFGIDFNIINELEIMIGNYD